MALDHVQDRHGNRVEGNVVPRAAFERERHPAAADSPVDIAQQQERRRLQLQPAVGDFGRAYPLVTLDHVDNHAGVLRGCRGEIVVPALLHRREGLPGWVVAMQEHQAVELLVLFPSLRGPDALDHVVVHDRVELDKPFRMPPAQVGHQRVAGEVVRKDPVAVVLDKGKPVQPCEQLVRLFLAEDALQQGFGGNPRRRANLQRMAVERRGLVLDEVIQQTRHNIRLAIGGEGHVAPRDDIPDQRECQRVTVREPKHRFVERAGHVPRVEIGAAVGWFEVAQGEDFDEVGPTRA